MKAIGSNLHTLAFQNDCMYILLDSKKFIWEDYNARADSLHDICTCKSEFGVPLLYGLVD